LTGGGKGAVRLDHNTRWGQLSACYFSGDYALDDPYPTGQGGANVPGFNALSAGRSQFATLSLATALGASAINELSIGYMRPANNIGQPVGGVQRRAVQPARARQFGLGSAAAPRQIQIAVKFSF
jgi:hypothetical protein